MSVLTLLAFAGRLCLDKKWLCMVVYLHHVPCAMLFSSLGKMQAGKSAWVAFAKYPSSTKCWDLQVSPGIGMVDWLIGPCRCFALMATWACLFCIRVTFLVYSPAPGKHLWWKILKVPFLRIYSSLEHSTKSRRAWKILKVQFLRIYSSLEHSTKSWRAWKILKVLFLKIYSRFP